uniref:NTR domain-containing protein n=1 Tax=Acrobeloides nanus TaxID=290746 RepID=A0A914E3A2_9BILA
PNDPLPPPPDEEELVMNQGRTDGGSVQYVCYDLSSADIFAPMIPNDPLPPPPDEEELVMNQGRTDGGSVQYVCYDLSSADIFAPMIPNDPLPPPPDEEELTFLIVMSCKCQSQTAKVSYCNAHWVARVQILTRQTKQKMPEGSERRGLNNIRYNVKYVNVYKTPNEFKNATLPESIYTPSERPACGIILEAGKEYLLAGRYVNNIMLTQLCGQVLSDDPTKETFENVFEWQNVPKALEQNLQSKAFEPC